MLVYCPLCKYQLEGLPDQHRCPECGFEYDQDMTLFEQSSVLATIFTLVLALVAVGIFLMWPIRLRGLSAIFAPVGLAYLLYYVARYWLAGPNKVLVGREGFMLISGRRVRRVLEWRRISGVARSKASIDIRSATDGTVFSLTEGYVGSGVMLDRVFSEMLVRLDRIKEPERPNPHHQSPAS